MIYYSDMQQQVAKDDIVVEVFSNSSNFDMVCIVDSVNDEKVIMHGLYNEAPIEITVDSVRGRKFLSGWEKFGTKEQYDNEIINFNFVIPDSIDAEVQPKFIELWTK